ncbi:MAG: adenylate/guanylate cyclase domain-containing protein, partial [Chloroflexi bacterium]|nr:adenylate/guanylate cyclase domain-containing protein [Chloroflexota bacterium]
KTRAFAGCTPEKILAMQAAESPQVAEALKEILTATAASGQMEQYERIITELKDSAQATRGDYQRNMTMLQQMFDKALDSVKETAVAFSTVPRAVVAPQPDLSAQIAPNGTITVFFSDVEGSTAMNERLGDQRAQEVMGAHNAIVRRELNSYDGFEVKSMGDGFMLAFSSARNGVRCAIDIQRAMAAYSADHTDEPLRVRIGLHTGEAIRESDDYFGRNVILAARISTKAEGGQILVSRLLKELMESSGDIRFGEGQEVELKGISGSTRVHTVDWN